MRRSLPDRTRRVVVPPSFSINFLTQAHIVSSEYKLSAFLVTGADWGRLKPTLPVSYELVNAAGSRYRLNVACSIAQSMEKRSTPTPNVGAQML
jgi:hypothetical protein